VVWVTEMGGWCGSQKWEDGSSKTCRRQLAVRPTKSSPTIREVHPTVSLLLLRYRPLVRVSRINAHEPRSVELSSSDSFKTITTMHLLSLSLFTNLEMDDPLARLSGG
jgi:hypothetical protein